MGVPSDTPGKIAYWCKVAIFPIIAFVFGLSVLTVEIFLDKTPNYTAVAVGLIATGLGPVGLLDIFRTKL